MIESAEDSRHSFLRALLLWSVRFRTGSAPEQGSRMAASRSALEIAADLCIYTNRNIEVEEIQ